MVIFALTSEDIRVLEGVTGMDAAIELFRNGDVMVQENGAMVFTPRELPFAHDGFGQDDDWVRANFRELGIRS